VRELGRIIGYLSKKMGRKMIIATILLGVALMITGTYLVANSTSKVYNVDNNLTLDNWQSFVNTTSDTEVYIGGILSIIGLVLAVIGVGVAFTQRFEDMSESSKKIARFIALLIIIALISVCLLLLVWLH